MTGAGGFSGKRRKTIRRVAEGARAHEFDRIVSKVIEALEMQSSEFATLGWTRSEATRLALVGKHHRSLPDYLPGMAKRVVENGHEANLDLTLAKVDTSASFDAEVSKFVRATADLAEERRATIVSLAEMSARGDRIDRVQRENRAALTHLLAS
jgi:hypothetical protein